MAVDLLSSLWEFLTQNSIALIGWVVAFLTGAVFAPYVTHRLRRSEERKAGHLIELKEHVFQQMLAYLDEHVLPVLRRDRGNIGLCHKRIMPSNGLDRPIFKDVLCLRSTSEAQGASHDLANGDEIPDPPQGSLMEDARHNHFRSLIADWDKLVERFKEYNDACLHYVEILREEILRETILPEYGHQGTNQKWVHAAALAIFVFYRQVGLPAGSLELRREEHGVQGLIYKTYALVLGSIGEYLPVHTLVKTMLENREDLQKLVGLAASLERGARTLRSAVEDQLHTRRLQGRCHYL